MTSGSHQAEMFKQRISKFGSKGQRVHPSNDSSSATRRTKRTACNRGTPAGFAAAPYWSSSSYSWPSGRALKSRWQSEAVNNSAALEMIMVDKLMKKLVQLALGKRARTGPLRICSADRSTIVTILSSGAGRAFIRNESSR